MAEYDEHIRQSIRNLEFLGLTNKHSSSTYDWQVTISFYVAVHIINAHLAKCQNIHYRSHEEVKNAISPTTTTSLCRIDETPYLCYEKLSNCSRRSRYLICDDVSNKEDRAFFTSEKYFARSIRNLDSILSYFNNKYGIEFPKTHIICPRLQSDKLNYFTIQQ